MSGFEVAGIVLGAFPIVLEGLKYYKDTRECWENWHEIRREYQACLNDLEIEQTFFNFNLRYLLLPLVAEPQQIEALIAHPGGKEWANPDLDGALRQKLHYSYDIYMKTVRSMKVLLENAKNLLGIEKLQARFIPIDGNDGIYPFKQASQKRSLKKEMTYQLARLRFSMGQATRKEFFSKLQACNKTLRELLDSSDRIQLLGPNMLFGRYTEHTLDARICEFSQYAQDVYRAFSGAWTCPCRDQHQILLMLQHRMNNDRDLCLILRETSPDQNGVPSGHGVTIRKASDSEDLGLDQSSQTSEQAQMNPPPSKLKMKKQAATNALSVRLQESTKGKQVDSAVMDHTMAMNLCSKIMVGFDSDPCTEYLQSDDRKYYIFSRAGPVDRLDVQQLSLEDVLCGSRVQINRRQRYTISLILVSSFIQLRETSWITSSWEKSRIFFPEQKIHSNTSDLNEPFLAHRLQSASSVDLEPHHPMQDFSSLAVTLLELCFGKVIENHSKRPKLHSGIEDVNMKAAFDAHAASYWLEDVTDEVGPDYKDAIAWCLSKHTTLSSPRWRQEMFQQVIRPLCEIIRPWASHPSRDLE